MKPSLHTPRPPEGGRRQVRRAGAFKRASNHSPTSDLESPPQSPGYELKERPQRLPDLEHVSATPQNGDLQLASQKAPLKPIATAKKVTDHPNLVPIKTKQARTLWSAVMGKKPVPMKELGKVEIERGAIRYMANDTDEAAFDQLTQNISESLKTARTVVNDIKPKQWKTITKSIRASGKLSPAIHTDEKLKEFILGELKRSITGITSLETPLSETEVKMMLFNIILMTADIPKGDAFEVRGSMPDTPTPEIEEQLSGLTKQPLTVKTELSISTSRSNMNTSALALYGDLMEIIPQHVELRLTDSNVTIVITRDVSEEEMIEIKGLFKEETSFKESKKVTVTSEQQLSEEEATAVKSKLKALGENENGESSLKPKRTNFYTRHDPAKFISSAHRGQCCPVTLTPGSTVSRAMSSRLPNSERGRNGRLSLLQLLAAKKQAAGNFLGEEHSLLREEVGLANAWTDTRDVLADFTLSEESPRQFWVGVIAPQEVSKFTATPDGDLVEEQVQYSGGAIQYVPFAETKSDLQHIVDCYSDPFEDDERGKEIKISDFESADHTRGALRASAVRRKQEAIESQRQRLAKLDQQRTELRRLEAEYVQGVQNLIQAEKHILELLGYALQEKVQEDTDAGKKYIDIQDLRTAIDNNIEEIKDHLGVDITPGSAEEDYFKENIVDLFNDWLDRGSTSTRDKSMIASRALSIAGNIAGMIPGAEPVMGTAGILIDAISTGIELGGDRAAKSSIQLREDGKPRHTSEKSGIKEYMTKERGMRLAAGATKFIPFAGAFSSVLSLALDIKDLKKAIESQERRDQRPKTAGRFFARDQMPLPDIQEGPPVPLTTCAEEARLENDFMRGQLNIIPPIGGSTA